MQRNLSKFSKTFHWLVDPGGNGPPDTLVLTKTVRITDTMSAFYYLTYVIAESGIVVTAENTLVDASSTPYARLYVS